MSEQLTYEAFIQSVNTMFQVEMGADRHVELELTDVSERKLTPRQEQFAIVFRGSSDAFLGQGTRLMTNERMGEFDLFLVPIRQDTQGFYYEAVFNRIRGQEETAG